MTYRLEEGIVTIFPHMHIGPKGTNTTGHQAYVFHLPANLKVSDKIVLNAPGYISSTGSGTETVTLEIQKVNDANWNVAVADGTAFSTAWQASATVGYESSYPAGAYTFEWTPNQAEYRTHASNGLGFMVRFASCTNSKAYSSYGCHMYLERKNA